MNAEEIVALVQTEIGKIPDPLVQSAIMPLLIFPSLHQRAWEYGAKQEHYPCWTVIRHKDSDTDLVYSEHGFGPKNPWGLVVISPQKGFGADSGWFRSLEEAFCDSFAASNLKIWNVVRLTGKAEKIIQAQNLDLDDAFALRDQMLSLSNDQTYQIERRQYYQVTT